MSDYLVHPDPATLPPASGEGSGSSGHSADYGGAEPNFTPTGDQDWAIDTSDGRVWWYFDGVWH